MRRRLSARVVITLFTTSIAAVTIILLIDVMRQSLSDAFPGAIPDTTGSMATVGALLIVVVAMASWWLTGYLLQPLDQLRRDLRLAARVRAVAEPHTGELAEIQTLRASLVSVLEEMDARTRSSESEQYRVLGMFESITEGIVQVGSDGRFLHVNAAARSLLGLPVNAEGKAVASLIRSADLRAVIERAVRGEDLGPTEVLIDDRQLLVSPQRARVTREPTQSVVVSVVDLTELRHLETVRRDFVANVSHELKTPLTSIRGYAETMIADELPRDLQVQFLEVVQRNASRLQRIVEELLDLSRLQSGGWQPELRAVEVRELARDVWSACMENAQRKQINFEILGDLTLVSADPGGLRQVLSNLFENAIRYTRAGGAVRTTIHPVSQDGGRRYVDIEVRDDGIGIPAEALPRIFERFFRVDAARSREHGGTGLGLSIVKHLVDRMGGDVFAESELGKGTAIRVRLPAAGSNV
jgi:two-component system, OmpR family, phosphate regulon sensor histidine kinase PhoR